MVTVSQRIFIGVRDIYFLKNLDQLINNFYLLNKNQSLLDAKTKTISIVPRALLELMGLIVLLITLVYLYNSGLSNNDIISKILLAHSHSVTSPTSFSQAGVIPVLEKNIGEGDETIKKIVERYQKQRDIMVQLLRSISGVDCHLPDGTFFVFPDVSSYGSNSSEISNYLLDYHNVATVPGNAFGPSGEGFLRLVFKSDINSIKSGKSL